MEPPRCGGPRDSAVKGCKKWWESLNYSGDGILVGQLQAGSLQLARSKTYQFGPLFNPDGGNNGMHPEVLSVHPQQSSAKANANVLVNVTTMRSEIAEVVDAPYEDSA